MIKKALKPSREFFLETVAVGIVVVTVSLVVAGLTDAQPGSAAEWIAAVSTFAAFVAAVVAAAWASRAYELEVKRDRRRDDSERRAQAALVAAWGGLSVEQELSPGPLESPLITAARPTELQLSVRNASELPVNRFTLKIYAPARAGHPDDDLQHVASCHLGTIPPGPQKSENVLDGDLYAALMAMPDDGHRPWRWAHLRLGWTLRDMATRDWERFPNGDLNEEPRNREG